MLEKSQWTRRPIEDIENTAEEMSRLCCRGECPIIIDASSGCPVMEMCRKSCIDIERGDWRRWLEAEIAEAKRNCA